MYESYIKNMSIKKVDVDFFSTMNYNRMQKRSSFKYYVLNIQTNQKTSSWNGTRTSVRKHLPLINKFDPFLVVSEPALICTAHFNRVCFVNNKTYICICVFGEIFGENTKTIVVKSSFSHVFPGKTKPARCRLCRENSHI